MIELVKAVDTVSPEKSPMTSSLHEADKKMDNFFKGREDSLFPIGERDTPHLAETDVLIRWESSSDARGLLPQNGGSWEGDKGDSLWSPDRDVVPSKMNPDQLTWDEILHGYGIDSIEFIDGEPDFSKISEATVQIDDFTPNRAENFAQADQKLAEEWTSQGKDEKVWTANDVRDYRREHGLTWHERSDTKTLDMVPSIVHSNVPHSGGISVAKSTQNNSIGG